MSLVVAISSRALFDLEEGHSVFHESGLIEYARYQRDREEVLLSPGIAFPLVKKLLALNSTPSDDAPKVEVILISRNSADTGLRIFNSIQHHGLDVKRAIFTSGAPTWPYVKPFGAHLFLSADADAVKRSLDHGVAAATILPTQHLGHISRIYDDYSLSQIRIAFDGDAVIFDDASERVSRDEGLLAFAHHEQQQAHMPLSGGPFKAFLDALHRLQASFPAQNCPIRTALVTARCAPAHERVIRTLREWGIRLDEALFLGGRPKGPFLQAFGADIFFDDSPHNIDSAREHVAAGHVPHGVVNRSASDD
jgi:5'-nucleotidase